MIYFDNSATTKPRKEVLDAYLQTAERFFGNPSSIHSVGMEAENLLSRARRQMAGLLGVKEREIIFTSGGTEGNNLAIKGIARKFQRRGRHIIASAIEHPSVINACRDLEKEGFSVTWLPVDHDGRIRPEELEQSLRDDTILVSLMLVNNETGVIQPVEEAGAIISRHPKVHFHVDCVQGIGKVPVDFSRCHIDLATLSAHKFHGVKGTGALFIREGIRIEPILSGGNQERGIRSGTENVPGIVAMAKALRLAFENMDEKINTMKEIQTFLRHELGNLEGVKIHTPAGYCAPHILNFSIAGFKAEVFVHALSEKGVYVSTTSACSAKRNEPSRTLLAMGENERALSSIRISLSYENTMEEAQRAVQIIKECMEELKPMMERSS
jgi:Aminotransferase class-V.